MCNFGCWGPFGSPETASSHIWGGPKQRLVLAMLIRADGRPVTTDALVDGLWGEDPPSTARKTVQGYIHHLRGELGNEVVVSEPNGYSLQADGNIDAVTFERLQGEGRADESPWFSSDSKLMITTFDGSVRLWDVASGTQIGDPFPHDSTEDAGGAEGEVLRLATASGQHILVWNLDTSSWFDIACQAAGRNMTRVEWDQFGPRDTDYGAPCPQYEIEE